MLDMARVHEAFEASTDFTVGIEEEFAILDPENSRPEVQGMPPAGSFSWHELATSD